MRIAWGVVWLAGAGVVVLLNSGTACNPGADQKIPSTTQPGSNEEPSGQPLPGDGDACDERGYFNATYHFGFDPPMGYFGPTPAFGSNYAGTPVLHEVFSVPLVNSRRIDIEVFASPLTLNQWVAGIQSQRLLGGNVMVLSETFVTDGGLPATLLIWTSAQGTIYEAFGSRGATIIALHAQFSPLDSAFADTSIRASMRSLCISTD